MNKQLILRSIKLLAKNKEITKKEIVAAYYEGSGHPLGHKVSQEVFRRWFYFFGAIIVFLGVSILLSDHWDHLSFFTRITATLGSGTAAYLCGLIFQVDSRYRDINNGFFLISALLLPLGFYVLLEHLGVPGDSNQAHIITSGFLLILFTLSLKSFVRP